MRTRAGYPRKSKHFSLQLVSTLYWELFGATRSKRGSCATEIKRIENIMFSKIYDSHIMQYVFENSAGFDLLNFFRILFYFSCALNGFYEDNFCGFFLDAWIVSLLCAPSDAGDGNPPCLMIENHLHMMDGRQDNCRPWSVWRCVCEVDSWAESYYVLGVKYAIQNTLLSCWLISICWLFRKWTWQLLHGHWATMWLGK